MHLLKRTLKHSLFTRHLFITNVVASGSLLGLGDCIIQNLETLHIKRKTEVRRPYDFHRTGRMFIIGLILGPFSHHWYRLLDKYVTGSGVKVVFKKIACDQAVAGPFFCSAFLIGSGLLEGKKFSECGKEWQQKFLTIYMADWCLWPPAQFINFYYLPTNLRVLYVCMITLCWNTFLSFMKHKDQQVVTVPTIHSENQKDTSV
ncbi:hypothetical protein ACOMHN_046273 [Nucella lapillus]